MGQYLDLENNCVFANGVAAVVGGTTSGDVDGTTVDLLGYGACTLIGIVGAEGDTYGSTVFHEFQVEESDDDSTWTDVADADLSTSVTGGSGGASAGVFGLVDADGEAPGIFVTTYTGSSRYVRGVTMAVGTHTNGTPIALLTIKHRAKVLPAA